MDEPEATIPEISLPTIQPHDYEGASWEVKDYIRELKLVITDLEQRLECGAQAVISLSALAEEANAGRLAAEAKVAFLEALNKSEDEPAWKNPTAEDYRKRDEEVRDEEVTKQAHNQAPIVELAHFGVTKDPHAGGRPPERVPTAEESVVVAEHIAAWGSTRFQTLADQLGISKGMAHRWVTKLKEGAV